VALLTYIDLQHIQNVAVSAGTGQSLALNRANIAEFAQLICNALALPPWGGGCVCVKNISRERGLFTMCLVLALHGVVDSYSRVIDHTASPRGGDCRCCAIGIPISAGGVERLRV